MKSRSAETILDESYLETRAKLLQVAAILDRIDRACDGASGPRMNDTAAARHDQLIQGIRLLLSDSPRRAQEIQQLFSRAYDPDWRATFGLLPEHSQRATSGQTSQQSFQGPASSTPTTPDQRD